MPQTLEVTGDRIEAPEAAAFLGVSIPSLYAAVRKARVPHWRIGRNVRFSRQALEAFVERGGTVSGVAA